MDILIHRDGQNYGPYTLEQVKGYVADGSLLESDLAWYEGCTDWVVLGDIITPAAASRRVAPSVVAQPKVNKTVKKAGQKKFFTQQIIGLIVGVVFIGIIIACFVYAALVPVNGPLANISARVHPAMSAVAPPSNTGGTATPATAAPVTPAPTPTAQSQQKQPPEENIHPSAASLIGTYSGMNQEKEKVTLQLNEDYTFVLVAESTASKRTQGIWKIVASSGGDYVSLLTPNGETVLMDEFTDPDHPGTLVDSHNNILTKTELK